MTQKGEATGWHRLLAGRSTLLTQSFVSGAGSPLRVLTSQSNPLTMIIIRTHQCSRTMFLRASSVLSQDYFVHIKSRNPNYEPHWTRNGIFESIKGPCGCTDASLVFSHELSATDLEPEPLHRSATKTLVA